MSNSWLRLWHDMPNDPKWRTIARISKQRIGDVIAVYTHMLVMASMNGNADVTQCNAVKRGYVTGWCDDDVGSALDLEKEQVKAIREAMEGKVLEGEYLTGWESRQPKREDNSSERVRAYRENKKHSVTLSNDSETQCNADVTQCNASEEIREEKIKKEKNTKKRKPVESYSENFNELWKIYPRRDGSKANAYQSYLEALTSITHEILMQSVDAFSNFHRAKATETEHIPHAATWLNQKRWESEYTINSPPVKRKLENMMILGAANA